VRFDNEVNRIMSFENSEPLPFKGDQQRNRANCVYIYLRVSSKKQGANGKSLEDQKAEALAYCRQNGWTPLQIFSDVHSARHEDEGSQRRGFNEICKAALSSGYPIVVARCDRFSRTYASYERFEERGGRLIAIELGLGASVSEVRALIKHAEAEANQSSRTCKVGIALARAKGRKTGNPNPVEARAASIAKRAANKEQRLAAFKIMAETSRAAGLRTAKEIVDWLNESSGLMTASGRSWTISNFRRLLREIRPEAPVKSSAASPKPGSTAAPTLEALSDDIDPHSHEVQEEFHEGDFLPRLEGVESDGPLQVYPDIMPGFVELEDGTLCREDFTGDALGHMGECIESADGGVRDACGDENLQEAQTDYVEETIEPCFAPASNPYSLSPEILGKLQGLLDRSGRDHAWIRQKMARLRSGEVPHPVVDRIVRWATNASPM
jgi:DNA invertase Pin-like site-specific DNA recombinase